MDTRPRPTVTIREARPADAAGWRILWQDYLAFYAIDLDSAVTASVWSRVLDPDSRLTLRLAEAPGDGLLGFALHHWHDSTWSLAPDGYLEDLFVAPDARGRGVGRALIDDLIALARGRGWGRLYWMTDQSNAPARALYDSYVSADGHIRYRIDLRQG